MKDINIIIQNLLKSDFFDLKNVPINEDYFLNAEGVIETYYLKQILELSKKKKIAFSILIKLFDFCDEKTIDNELFLQIKKYPSLKKRKTLLIEISHCPLSVYQLSFIASKKICIEAFAQLLDVYLKNDCFSIYDVKALLDENKNYLLAIDKEQLMKNASVNKTKLKIVFSYK